MNNIKPFIHKEENGELIAHSNPEFELYERQKKFEYYLRESGIPKEYYKYTFENAIGIPRSIKDTCIRYVEDFNKTDDLNLYINGSHTVGKTSLACIVGQELLKQGKNVKFVLAKKFVDSLLKNQGYSKDEDGLALIQKLKMADVIIIDDIFDKQKMTYWQSNNHLVESEIDAFLRDNISNNIRFILTSNFSITQIGNDFGQNIKELLKRKFKEIEYSNEELKIYRRERIDNS